MLKKYSIIIFSCLSLLVIAGCGKPATNGSSANLQNCQSICDKQSVMYKGSEASYKSECYGNCQKIEDINQGKGENTDTNNDGKDTTNNGGTTTTNEEVMTDKNCDDLCSSYMRTTATSEEKKSCLVSCKAEVKIQSNDISDCNNIETTSEGLMDKDTCIATKAIAQKNLAYCEMIKDENTLASCYTAIAQDSNDKSLCNRIKNEENKTYCNMMFTQE